jgi:hypothetical protein
MQACDTRFSLVLAWPIAALLAIMSLAGLAFGLVMAASIAGMMVAIGLAGDTVPVEPIGGMLAIAAANAIVLWRVRHPQRVTDRPSAPPRSRVPVVEREIHVRAG